MKACKVCGVVKLAAEFHRRRANKDGRQRLCKLCHHAANIKWLRDNHDELRPKLKAYHAEHYLKNKVHWKLYGRKYYNENYSKFYEKMVRRQMIKRKALPTWVNKIALNKIYIRAAKRRMNGEDVQIDHIVPLQHKLVCGLHVHYNLRIISRLKNIKKSNYFEVS